MQLIGTSAQRRAEGGGRPGEFDVEQLLSLFVQRAIRIQEAEGGGAGAGGPPPAGGTTPTSRRAIESLSAVTADDSHAGDSCTICFEEFEAGSSEVLSLPCEHFFCKACILPWLEKTNSCPVCRHELETEEPPGASVVLVHVHCTHSCCSFPSSSAKNSMPVVLVDVRRYGSAAPSRQGADDGSIRRG